MADTVRKGPHCEFRAPPGLAFDRIEGADREGEEVRRHPRRLREPHEAGAIPEILLVEWRRVRDRRHPIGDDEGHLEGRLRGGLVPAGEGAPCVRRLELGRGHVPLLPVGHRVPASVEAREFVVERAGKREPQGRGTGGDGLGEVQPQHLTLRIEIDRGRRKAPALRRADRGLADLESFRVQRDRLRGPRDLNPDRLAPLEREGLEVRSQLNRILLRSHGIGQAVFRGHDAPFPSQSPGRSMSNI